MSFEGFEQDLKENMTAILENEFFALAATYVERHRGEPDPYSKAIKEFVDDYFDALNIHPRFVAEERPEFSEMRGHLYKDSGFIISNHIGEYKDIPAIASVLALRGDDVLIMVKKQLVERLSVAFGRRFIVPAPSAKPRIEVDNALAEVGKHISTGGAFLIFPDGRVTQEIKFKPFVSLLLARPEISDEDMVYMFYLDPAEAEAQSAELNSRLMAVGPGLLGQKIQSPLNREALTFAVDERCVRVGDLRGATRGLEIRDASRAITAFYRKQFGVD